MAADASFDAVLSTFGDMFAPDPARAASEMARVCRPGGRIGQVFKVPVRHVPPPAGVAPASLWGVESHVRRLFGEGALPVAVATRTFNLRYRSAAHFGDMFRTGYGPTQKAFAALAPEPAQALQRDLIELLERLNGAGPGSLVVPSGYLEIVVTRR